MINENLTDRLTISIATKDRHDVLDRTLRHLHQFGLENCPLILLDDGSGHPINPPSLSLFPRGELYRNEVSKGQAQSRNIIVKKCKTPFILQLDDDSYPVAGSVGSLLDFAERETDWVAIAIPFAEPARSRVFPENIPNNTSLQLKAFVGCSVLLRKDRFNSLGGYANWVGGWGEEEEFCIRAFLANMKVLTVDLLRIQHDVTNVGRDVASIVFRSYRNSWLAWWVHAPILVLTPYFCHLTFLSIITTIRNRDGAAVSGVCAGVRKMWSLRDVVSRITFEQYRLFRRLPHALDFFT